MGDRGQNRHGAKTGGCCAPFARGELALGRKQGAAVPLSGVGSWLPCNTMRPGPRPTFVPSGILIHPDVWPQQTWAENWRGLCPFRGGGAGSQLLATIVEMPRSRRWNTLTDYLIPSLYRQNIYRMRALSYCSTPIKIKYIMF